MLHAANQHRFGPGAFALFGLVFACATPAVAAQEDATPPKPLVRAHAAGPSRWHQEFLATNLGGLLAAKESGPFTGKWIAMLRGGLGPLGQDKTWAALRDYRGWFDLEVFVQYDKTAAPPERVLAVLRLGPDQDTDLQVLIEPLTELLSGRSVEKGEVRVGERSFPILESGSEAITIPFVRNGALAVALSTDLETDMPRALAALDRMAAVPAVDRRPPFGMTLDLSQVAELSFEGRPKDHDERKIGQLLWGIESIGDLELTVRPAGPQVMIELAASWSDDERGLFKGLFPDVQGKPEIVRLIPDDAKHWKAGRLRLDRLIDTAIDGVSMMFGSKDRAEVDAEIRKEFGFHPVDDVLVHFGDEVLIVGRTVGQGDGLDDLIRGACFAFELEDSKAFHERWPAMRDKLMSSVCMEWSEEDSGAEVPIASGPSFIGELLTVAANKDYAFLAFGIDGNAVLKDVVLQSGKPAAERKMRDVERVLRHAPTGLNGYAMADVRDIVAGYLGLVTELISEEAPSLGIELDKKEVGDALSEPIELLEKYRLDKVVTMTGFKDRRWAFRIFW